MYVKAVHGVDAQCEALQCILLHATCGGGEDGYVHILEFAHVLHHGVGGQLGGAVHITIAAYYTCQLHIGSSLQCLQGIFTYVAISYDGYSDFPHILKFYLFQKIGYKISEKKQEDNAKTPSIVLCMRKKEQDKSNLLTDA